jgi:hypothetical protein
MTVKPNLYILLGLIFAILTLLFTGLFRDDEFNEPGLFIKHRPTFKLNFYSPIGMEDIKADDLEAGRKKEELAFREFVIKQHVQNNDNAISWYLPYILIQLTLTFLFFGYFKFKRKPVFRKWQLPVHFVICLIVTFFGLVFSLAFDKLILTIILIALVLLANYFTLFLMTRRNQV